ncbi:MAG: tetratricopeptide repeat protein [Bacteroidota bacterium]
MITVSKINARYNRINTFIAGAKVKDALEELRELISASGFGDFFVQLEYAESTYEQMLRYMLEGVNDPQRDRIYLKLQVSILELADQVRASLLEKHSGWHTYTLKQDLSKKQKLTGRGVIETLDDLAFKTELDELLRDEGPSFPLNSQKKRDLDLEIFRHLWLSDRYTEAENNLAETIISSREFAWHEKALTVSAILLSLLRYWNEDKVHRLIDFAETDEPEVSVRSLVSLFIVLYVYDKRLRFYPDIMTRLHILGEKMNLEKYLENTALQLIRARDTLEIGRKLQEDLIPEVAKLKPDLEDKLLLDDLKGEDEEGNPDWESMFRESDQVYKKVEEFMKLQMEGADVYMTTFAHLKSFPFFNEMTNWLVPFYNENPDLQELYASGNDAFDPELFVEGLKRTPFLCNSDKYSFIFNVRYLPPDQKKMLSAAFAMEMEGLDEMLSDDELSSGSFRERIILVQYIQDLYRFFKISPFKSEFEDIFGGKLDLYNAGFYTELVNDQHITRNIAEYFFEKNHFEEALDVFRMLLNDNPGNPELLEKAGFCLQRTGQHREALACYEKIGWSGSPGIWVLKNMARCYRQLEQYGKALECYEEIERQKPGDSRNASLIAYCNMKLGDYDTAIQQYFRLEYADPGNLHLIRPIAWCYFALNEPDKAENYFNKVLQSAREPGYFDFVNFGHVRWAQGRRKEAVDLYLRAIQDPAFSFDLFLKTLDDDRPMLLKNRIQETDFPLMMDYLHYRLK